MNYQNKIFITTAEFNQLSSEIEIGHPIQS